MTQLRRTPLHARHVELGARMVAFGGWEMPVYYTAIAEEHRAVRARAGVFDVSHMGQISVRGAGASDYLQGVLSNNLDRIGDNQAQYTLLTSDDGGILDDLICYRNAAGDYLLVVNAANTAADHAWLQQHSTGRVSVEDDSARFGMLALQGPSTPAVLERLGFAFGQLAPFGFVRHRIGGVDGLIARTGYTGELGVEIITAATDTEAVFDALTAQRELGVVPCGLGARDTLRLEVCYPLHGADITPQMDPIAAGLGFACDLAKDFTGAAVLRRVAADEPASRLVAFRMTERAIPRHGMRIHRADDTAIGDVTSGTLSPSLDQGIGLGYVTAAEAVIDNAISIDIRGRRRSARVAAKPLYRKEPDKR